MNAASAECLRNLSARFRHWMRGSSLIVILCGSLLMVTSVGEAHAAAPITPSGLNTQVSGPIVTDSGPTQTTQYDITGGTRPGGATGTNLFHSFGDFNVPTHNIANFLNAGSVDLAGNPLAAGLPTSNILGRVTDVNPSIIFGTIQTNGTGGFGNANLFLMNPYGFLFGPNATVNVGGMVTFTSADYLRLQGTGGNGVFYADPTQTSVLTSVPVAAFGFLGSNPGAITVQGSQLTVNEGNGINLVGGNITVQSGLLDDGVPNQAARLLAPSGQINLASAASPGEIMFPNLQFAPNINGQSFTGMGNISLSQEALLDVSGNPAGSVKIRGGQLVVNQASISADTSDADGAPVAIDINVTGVVSLSNTNLPVLTARTFGAGNAGDIVISSGSMTTTFGHDTFADTSHISLIDSSTMGSGNGGNVTITTGALSATNVPSLHIGHFILSGTAADGKGGNVSITAGDAQFTNVNIDTGGLTTFFGPGAGGNLAVKAQSLILDNVLFGTDSMSRAGSINLESAGLLRMGGSTINSQSSLGNNPITIKADRFVLDNNTKILATTVFENGGDISVTSRTIEFSNSGLIATQTFGDGNAGNIIVRASEQVSFIDNPTMSTSLAPSGLYTTSLGGVGNFGNAGNITVTTPRLEIFTGARINASTFTSGHGGNVNITNANSVLMTGERSSLASVVELFVQGGTNASGIYTSTLGSEFCTGACGNAGNINITTGSLTLQNGGLIDSGTSNNGHGGNITIGAIGQVLLSGTMADGTPGGIFSRTIGMTPDTGPGGNIALTAGQSVTISDGASVSASSAGPGDAGNIAINAGQQLDIMGNSSIKTEAKQASGGNIDIQAIDRVRLVNSSISTSVLGGAGSGGNITIDPNVVALQNSQVIAQAVQGAGGNITITTPSFFADSSSLVSASSQFGRNGTVTIQSPTSNLSESLGTLPSDPSQAHSLVTQRCAALANGQTSSFVVAGREQLPADPGGWLTSPLAFAALGGSLEAGHAVASAPAIMPIAAHDTGTVSLRRLTPAGFLMASFADSEATGCHS